MSKPFAYAIGICFTDSVGNTIAVKWISMNINRNLETATLLMDYFGARLEDSPISYIETKELLEDRNKQLTGLRAAIIPAIINCESNQENLVALRHNARLCFIFYKNESVITSDPILSIPDAHFRLAAISRLYYKPNTLYLENIFEVLPVLVWNHAHSDSKKKGPLTEEEWNRSWHDKKTVDVVIDQFPPLLWGAPIPSKIRMSNYLSARLGAYLSPGTVIMPYGFVNFNAGTLGKAMVEGTIAAGVTIGDGTHVGKAAGFLGTISGGNKVKISTGKNCLIGAQAECGIPLGDNCIISLGVSFTENTPVLNKKNNFVHKAKEYAHMSNITFRRNSLTGKLEVLDNK